MKARMKFKWKSRTGLGMSAQALGECLYKLVEENDGALLPATVVRCARPKRSLLHQCFEWDDKKAAKQFREDQARYMIRHVVVEQSRGEDSEPLHVRAFVSVGDDEGGRYYTTIHRAVQDDVMYGEIVEQAFDDYTALRNKYKHLREFREINQAIDAIEI